jgi:hypothetical protein
MRALTKGRRLGAVMLVPVDVACDRPDPAQTSVPCGSTEVRVHDHGHAWCSGCGRRKDVPEYSPPPKLPPRRTRTVQGGLFDDHPDDGYTEARGK